MNKTSQKIHLESALLNEPGEDFFDANLIDVVQGQNKSDKDGLYAVSLSQ